MTPVRFGFLGAGFVAGRALAPAVHRSPQAELHAAASRDLGRASSLGPARAVDDYAQVLADDQVEVVYISLANDQHLPWVEMSLKSGKHVLCEKPLCLTAADAKRAFEAARRHNRLLVEAAWNCWHPRTQRAAALIAEGAVGRVVHVDARFCFGGVRSDNFRLVPELGGGALLDVGGYLVGAARWALGGGPLSVVDAESHRGPTGVDLSTRARLSQDGGLAEVVASIDGVAEQALAVVGDTGRLVVRADPFTSWHVPSHLDLERGDRRLTESFEPLDAYQLMVEAVARRVRGEPAWVVEPAESIAVAEVLDAIREAVTRSPIDAP